MAYDYEIETAELEAIARRDQDAFSRWFARCEIPLKRSLRNFAEVVDVEAVIQDTAIKVWEGASKIEPDGRPECLLRWALTVARNAARNAATRAGHQVPLEVHPEDAGAPVVVAGDPILRVRIRRCLEQLRTNPRRVLAARLADSGQRRDRDLATSMGMSFDAFRQNLARGRHALEQCLRGFGIDVRQYVR